MLQLDVLCFFFFFQAEDGIRDYKVTGVQTCALPICMVARRLPSRARASSSSVRACSASVGSTLLQSMAELAPPLARRSASETDRLRASGSHDWTVSWSMARRCSMAVEGSGRELPSSLSMAARTSTLPRLRRGGGGGGPARAPATP